VRKRPLTGTQRGKRRGKRDGDKHGETPIRATKRASGARGGRERKKKWPQPAV